MEMLRTAIKVQTNYTILVSETDTEFNLCNLSVSHDSCLTVIIKL